MYQASNLCRSLLLVYDSEIFPSSTEEDFNQAVRLRVLEDMDGLDPTALLTSKSLLRSAINERNNPDAVNLRETYGE